MWQNMDETMCLRLHEQDMRRAWQHAQGSQLPRAGKPARLNAPLAVKSFIVAVKSWLPSPLPERRAAE